MPSVKDRLRAVKLPPEYRREFFTPEFLAQALLGKLQYPQIEEEIFEALGGTELRDLTDSGRITTAMVKPDVAEAVIPDRLPPEVVGDAAVTRFLLDQIKPPLKAVFEASMVLKNEEVEIFYPEEVKVRQTDIPPIDKNRYGGRYNNRWKEYLALMTNRGPVTFALLHQDEDDVVSEWRRQIGTTWNVEILKQTEPDSLRGYFAIDNHNNLFHGSDSKKSVKRELALLIEFLKTRSA